MDQSKNPLTAGLYVRVSTMNQIDRDSLNTQTERLVSFCKVSGIDHYKLYRDAGYSAKDTKRPGLQALMRDIQKGAIKIVYTAKLDRITRSLADFLQLTKFFNTYRVNFISISENIDTNSAMGRAMQSLMAIFAQLEREVTAERVATDMRHRANAGKWNGGVVPYGYTTQSLLEKKYKESGINPIRALEMCPEPKKIYLDSDESRIVKWIYENYLKTMSVRKTTIELNESGVKTRHGKLWAKTTIHRILTNPTYAGMIWYGKRKNDPVSGRLVGQEKDTWTIVDGEHDSIISQEIFYATQKSVSKKQGKPTRANRSYLLSGILRCGHCGGAMTGHTFTRQGGKSYSYYKCYSRLQKGLIACKGISLPANQMEDFIISVIKKLSRNKAFLQDKKKMLDILDLQRNENRPFNEVATIDNNIRDLNNRLQILLDKMERNLISDEDFQPRYQQIKNELAQLAVKKTSIVEIEKTSFSAIQDLKASFDEISSFEKNWEYLNDVGKTLRLRSIVREIRATKEKIDMDIYLDVAEVSRMDTDSWPQ